MTDLPRLSPAQQRAVEALLEGADEAAAYMAAYPNAMSWKPETVAEKAKELFKLSAVKAHVQAERRRRRVTPKKKAPAKKRPAAKKQAPAKQKAPAKGRAKGKAAADRGEKARPPGRPSIYTPELVEQARAYLTDYAKHGDAFPNVAGLAVALGTHRDTLYAWARDETKPEFSDILAKIKTRQEAVLLSKGATGEFNSVISKMLLSSKHGYHEIQSVEHSGRGGGPIVSETKAITTDMDPEEAARIYQSMLGKE